MSIIALLAREHQNAVFWGPMIARLKSHHNFTLRTINRTPSTPADLTFSQLPLSMFLIAHNKLDNDVCERIDAIVRKARRVVLVVQSNNNRAWEEIQLQAALANLAAFVLPVFAPFSAAQSITSFTEAFAKSPMPEPVHCSEAAQLLRCLELDDPGLQLLCDSIGSFSDLVKIVQTPRDRGRWVMELSEDIVCAIEDMLAQDDAY